MIQKKGTKALLAELKAELKTIYSSRLKGLYLYGSYARGEQQEGSDVDVLIVLDEIPHYAAEIMRTGPLVSRLSLHYDISVSRVFFSEREWLTKDTSFLANVREEAIAA